MGSLLDPTDSQVAQKQGGNRRAGKDRRRKRDEVGLVEKVKNWCRGKSGNARAPLGIWFAIMFLFYAFNQDAAAHIALLTGVTHKLGHWIWGLIDKQTPIAGGWLLQFGVPILLMFVFYRWDDYYGIAITFAWMGTVFLWNSPYCVRAESGEFPRSILRMNEPVHCWNELLTNFNIMSDAGDIAASLRWGGLLALAFGIYFLGSQLYFMYTLEERRKEMDRRMDAIAAGKS